MSSHQDARNSREDQSTVESKSVDAIRHVGPTLEAEGKYDDVLGRELPTPESQIQESASSDTLSVRTIEEDRRRLSERNIEPEPLRTRLPGDTSSDPHTDVGPDNATTAHAHSEEDLPPAKAS